MASIATRSTISSEKTSTESSQRQYGFDVARGLAVFGMIIVNFKIAMGAETAGPSWMVWLVGLLDGRAAATFVILAGVGMSLLTHIGKALPFVPGHLIDHRTLAVYNLIMRQGQDEILSKGIQKPKG